jgi:hypothetical protein
MRIRMLFVALCCACSYAEEKPRVVVSVANVPADAGTLDVTVTDSANVQKTYHPLTAAADGGVLLLGFNAPTQNGRVDVHIVVPDAGVATTASGLYADPAELDLTARIGFATRCTPACTGILSCSTYGAGDSLCTHNCSNPSDCESTIPAASCDAGLCQWGCSDGGVCPPGLSCVTDPRSPPSAPVKWCSGI